MLIGAGTGAAIGYLADRHTNRRASEIIYRRPVILPNRAAVIDGYSGRPRYSGSRLPWRCRFPRRSSTRSCCPDVLVPAEIHLVEAQTISTGRLDRLGDGGMPEHLRVQDTIRR
jgi:hypothetical protein